MGERLQELLVGLAAGRKDNFRNFASADLAGRIEDAIAPPLAEGGDHVRLAEHFVARSVGVEHDRPQIAKAIRDHAFAAGNAADKARVSMEE
jgi:hypothetical protein